MIPFPTAAAVWPRGGTRWRMCVLPRPRGDRSLRRLLDQAHKALAPFPLAEVADTDLNIGICPLELPAQEPGERSRRDLSTALTGHLAGIPPFTMAVGPEHVGAGSILLELEPGRWPDMTERVGTGLGEVLDPHELGPMHTRPHLTIAYGAGHCDSAEIASALRTALRRERAEVLVDAVHLLQVRQDAPAHGYRLTAPTVTIPLGGARPAHRDGGDPR